MVKLKRLIPGANTSLSAVLGEDGKVLTDTGEMAAALIAHWQEVFTQREVDIKLLDQWHESLPPQQVAPCTGISTAVGHKGTPSREKGQVSNTTTRHPHRAGISTAVGSRKGQQRGGTLHKKKTKGTE